MLRIEECESIEAILKAQKLAEKAADTKVQEWQNQIKVGDCFGRSSDGLEIVGEVIENGLSKNWRKCQCYSIFCPAGRVGFVHVSQINDLIDRKVFEAAKDKLGKYTTGYNTILRR